MIKIKKGLDLPLQGAPKPTFSLATPVRKVGVLGHEILSVAPSMQVEVGDTVSCGQVLFYDKNNEGIAITAPAGGNILAINRGERRKLESIEIAIAENEEFISFPSYSENEIASLSRETIVKQLVDSGQWVAFRTRPFSKIPAITSTPHSIFVTAINSSPLAENPNIIINKYKAQFDIGLQILKPLTDGKIFVCCDKNVDFNIATDKQIAMQTFSGKHPRGLVGTHIHHLDPITDTKVVWHLNYQDVIAIGALFTEGKLFVKRFVGLGGDNLKNPRIVETRQGAFLPELLQNEYINEIDSEDMRVISGSVLDGHTAKAHFAYLGRYHNQVSLIKEGREKVFLGWILPNSTYHSVKNLFLTQLFKKNLKFTTNEMGSKRAMVPVGSYEKVFPFDTQVVFLLRALLTGNTDDAIALGCLELDEEDLALCSYVCPGKEEYGEILRKNLTIIEKEG